MDLLVLQRLTRALDERLTGVRIDRTFALPREHVAITLGLRGAPRLWFSSEPEHPHLYLREGAHPSPERPPAFAMAVRKLLAGRRIAGLELVGGDRVVRLLCEGEPSASLVFELIPRRATALLVDADGLVRATWHSRRGRPGVSEAWEPPRPRRRPQPDEIDDDTWKRMAAGPEPEDIARALSRGVDGLSLLIAREAAARHAEGASLEAATRAELARAREEPSAARIYSPGPLGELVGLPEARRFFLAPYPLRHAEALVSTRYEDLVEAASVFYPLRARLRLLGNVRDELGRALEVKVARTARAIEAVRSDRASHDTPEELRRRADLLLANPDATVDGQTVRLPDAYSEGETVEIRVDPSKSLVENAQRFYRKAQRAERAAEHTERRGDKLERRERTLRRLQEELDAATRLAECRQIATDASSFGIDVEIRADDAPEASGIEALEATAESIEEETESPEPSDAGVAGVSSYRSSDGLEILVGRNARANDRLTQRVAAPHDWWLHAEGPGSHVVVRNPERRETPPADTLREAASLAAHFSKSRGSTKVDVRWTQVRYLRKPKGAPPGQVILRRSKTVLAEPLPPERLLDSRPESP